MVELSRGHVAVVERLCPAYSARRKELCCKSVCRRLKCRANLVAARDDAYVSGACAMKEWVRARSLSVQSVTNLCVRQYQARGTRKAYYWYLQQYPYQHPQHALRMSHGQCGPGGKLQEMAGTGEARGDPEKTEPSTSIRVLVTYLHVRGCSLTCL